MQQPHRPRQGHVGGPHDHHLAAHAAQVGEAIARREAAAVDDEVARRLGGRDRRCEADRAAAGGQRLGQRRQRPARIEMGLARKEQVPRRKRPARSGSSAADPVGVEPVETFGAPGETRQGRSHRAAAQRPGCHWRTVPGKRRAPPVDRRRAPQQRPRARSWRARTTAPACRPPSTSKLRRPARGRARRPRRRSRARRVQVRRRGRQRRRQSR